MRLTIPEILEKMIAYSQGNMHDINHLIKVWTFARTIAEQEGMDEGTQYVLEVAAIVHDIACPLCRIKYGNTNGKKQEIEGIPLTYEFLKDSGMSQSEVERVAYLVGHHHTMDQVDGQDYQILLEADYLVNAYEGACSMENILSMREKLFRTKAGTRLLDTMYLTSYE